MLIVNRFLSAFSTHFSRNLQTVPLSKVKHHLISFLQSKVRKQQFEPSFSSYQTFLHQTLEDNQSPNPLKIDIFDLVTRIYLQYQLPSKRLIRLHNQLADECLRLVNKQSPQQLVQVLDMIQRYNKGRALALFKANKDNIVAKLRQFSPLETIQLLKFIKDLQIDDPFIRETALEILYAQMQYLNPSELHLLLESLAFSKKYINRQFVGRMGQRLLTLYRCGNVADKDMYGILASLSEIQANLHTRAVYVEELHQLYELAFPGLFLQAQHLGDNLLNRLVSALRRSKFYEETILSKLTKIAMQRTIREFDVQAKEGKKLDLSLRTFLNIIHTHAVFNFHAKQFKDYVKQVLKIIMLKQKSIVPQPAFTKLIWSLCVLFDRNELTTIYPLIQHYLSNAQQVPIHEATNMYYCYLYLRTTCPQINEHREKIHSFLEKHSLETHSSNIQMEVYNTIIQNGVPCIPEYNLNNIICDIMIPQWRNLKNVIVELHGFRHFCRNVKRLTGSNALKEKIVGAEMYRYYYITVDEWLVVEDKKQFIKQFLEHIDKLEQNHNKKPVIEAKTSTRVRRQPRGFKIQTQNQLIQ